MYLRHDVKKIVITPRRRGVKNSVLSQMSNTILVRLCFKMGHHNQGFMTYVSEKLGKYRYWGI